MNFSIGRILGSVAPLALLLLTACGGGGSGGGTSATPTPPPIGGAIQGKALNLAGTVSTFAGALPGTNGTGAAARFNTPVASVSDGSNLYVADSGNNIIRRIVIATGAVSTLAGQAGVTGSADGTGAAATFNAPYGITINGSNLYVADTQNHTIRQIVIATGAVSTLVGQAGVSGAAEGAGTAATFNFPFSVTTDGSNLYVADSGNSKIRQIVIATGAVSTLAGTGVQGSADGTGGAATFNWPQGITRDGSNLYVADSYNNKIRKIVIATGVVSTLAGANASGTADGTGTAARFWYPTGITSDGINLYVADSTNRTIRQIVIATGAVSTLAGQAGVTGSADGMGVAATFNWSRGITRDGGNLYVADTSNNTIRQIVIATGAVSTLAGVAGSTDGTGTAATLSRPEGITSDGINLYVADTNSSIIRRIVIATGAVSTLAGQAGVTGSADGTGTAATFNYPAGITTDGSNLYVADSNNNTIRKIVIATGAVSTLAGQAGVMGSADGTGTAATFSWPQSLTTDGGNLYVSDTDNHTIRKIVIATGAVSTLAGQAGVAGAVDGTGTAATLHWPAGITTDGSKLYVSDSGNYTIRQIVIATGAVSTLAGQAGVIGSADGAGTAATFTNPTGITTDGSKLYVTDWNDQTIRQIVIATGAVSTLAGQAGVTGAADGTGTAATFKYPAGITTDGSSLYVVDSGNSTTRKIR